jgi:predicted Fe-S protein YdhL (DUF1289 family)
MNGLMSYRERGPPKHSAGKLKNDHYTKMVKGIDSADQSPCVRNCCLNDDDICLGCFRSLDEIKRWGAADNHERIIILQNAKQRREAYCLGTGTLSQVHTAGKPDAESD